MLILPFVMAAKTANVIASTLSYMME